MPNELSTARWGPLILGMVWFAAICVFGILFFVRRPELDKRVDALIERSKLALAALMAVVVGPLCLGLWLSTTLPTTVRDSNFRPFEPYMSEYTTAISLEEAPGEAYLIGKVLVLHRGPYAAYHGERGLDFMNEDTSAGEAYFDDINFDLSAPLRAHSPDEVGTLIWLEWDQNVLATYTRSVAAQITCQVTIIDMGRHLIVGQQTFSGSKPKTPEVRSCPGSSGCRNLYGSIPTQDILRYIASLPRK